MVTTRSQSLSTRIQTTPKTTTRQLSDKTVSRRPITRSQNLIARTTSPYVTRSKRMNTRSNAKRFLELSDHQHVSRMTRSMTKFVDKYSDYTGVKTRSMTKCM